jgi:hypothetical protein
LYSFRQGAGGAIPPRVAYRSSIGWIWPRSRDGIHELPHDRVQESCRVGSRSCNSNEAVRDCARDRDIRPVAHSQREAADRCRPYVAETATCNSLWESRTRCPRTNICSILCFWKPGASFPARPGPRPVSVAINRRSWNGPCSAGRMRCVRAWRTTFGSARIAPHRQCRARKHRGRFDPKAWLQAGDTGRGADRAWPSCGPVIGGLLSVERRDSRNVTSDLFGSGSFQRSRLGKDYGLKHRARARKKSSSFDPKFLSKPGARMTAHEVVRRHTRWVSK